MKLTKLMKMIFKINWNLLVKYLIRNAKNVVVSNLPSPIIALLANDVSPKWIILAHGLTIALDITTKNTFCSICYMYSLAAHMLLFWSQSKAIIATIKTAIFLVKYKKLSSVLLPYFSHFCLDCLWRSCSVISSIV